MMSSEHAFSGCLGHRRTVDDTQGRNDGDSGFPNEPSKEAVKKAMALLLHKDRTEKELRDRLYKAGFEEEAVCFAMEYVSDFGYINDERYAEQYVLYHRDKRSRCECREKLRQKGISETIVESALSAFEDDVDHEEEAIRALLAKRLHGRSIEDLTFEEKQKQMRYLAGKGFSHDKICRIVR